MSLANYGRRRSSAPPATGRLFGINDTNMRIQYDRMGVKRSWLSGGAPRKKGAFVDNTVRTARFTLVTFLPLQIIIQFSKVANVYFFIISMLQLIPDVSPTGRFTTIFPLTFFVVVSMIKEGYDDYFRHKQDAAENKSSVWRFSPHSKTWEKVHCKDILVGDIVKLSDREFVPVDLIVLSSSNPDGVCFVETSNLDGETNLKQRQALKSCNDAISDLESLAAYKASVHAESPSGDLYSFDGYLQEPNGAKQPLTPIQLLQRGATVRNTKEVFGVAVYTGEESKIRMNSYSPPSSKTPHVEVITNKIVFLILLFLLVLAGLGTLAFILWDEKERGASGASLRHWYLLASTPYSLLFFTFVVLFNAFIPISLYVTMEIVKVWQVYFMISDEAMYDEERDIPAQANTSSLNEELGQVQYVFSDKTGTLTENIMEFRLFSVSGQSIRHPACPPRQDDSVSGVDVLQEIADVRRHGKSLSVAQNQVHDFILAMALCHSVIPDLSQSGSDSGNIVYQSSSADEVAIVNAARDLSFVYKWRKPAALLLNVLGDSVDQEFVLLATLEFTSDRKRMSTVYRYPDGRIVLLTKGADNVILERLKRDSDLTDAELMNKTRVISDTAAYANEGLRTLLYGFRYIPEVEFEAWQEKFADASVSLLNRTENLAAVAEELERNLTLLGATAIEDRLQDGVPETIENLRRANIRVWMLTGDKTETAINIGRTCSLIKKSSHVMVLNEDNCHVGKQGSHYADDIALVRNWINTSTQSFLELKGRAGMNSKNGVHILTVVEGRLLSKIEKAILASSGDMHIFESLLDLLIACDNVICCRFSPSQKALLVRKVKERLNKQDKSVHGASPLLQQISGGGSVRSPAKRLLDTILLKPRQSGVTLAIGDGANDIPMLLSSHVGVGITGREGLAASRASDYSIAKFRFLQTLLFVHGRWSYVRISLFILGTLYKNFCFYGTQAVFQFWVGFSGTSLYEQWTLACNNAIFTLLPVMVVGIFEKDLNRSTLMAVPELYRYGQENKGFNFRVQLRWLCQGVFHAIISVLVPALLFGGFYRAPTSQQNLDAPLFFSANTSAWFQQVYLSDATGSFQESALYPLGTISYTVTVFFCTIKVLYVESHNITAVHHVVAALTIGAWILYQFIYSFLWAPHGPFGADTGYEYRGLYYALINTQLKFWSVVVLTVIIGLVVEDVSVKFFSLLARLVHWGHWGGRREVVEVGGQDMRDPWIMKKSTPWCPPQNEYEFAEEAAKVAAAYAVGEHDWANEVAWWQFWEKKHGVRSDL